jgi:hypothetical protein
MPKMVSTSQSSRVSMRMSAAVVVAMVFPLLTFHELVEAADRAVGGAVLVQEAEALGLEFLEEVVPGDELQAFRELRLEVDAQDTSLSVAGAFDARRPSAAGVGPAADRGVIGGGLGVGQG